jgi:hypothetical protein
MDKPNSIEPHKTSQTPEEEEWRGGADSQRGREAQERSGERGWGAGPNSGGQRQQGDGGQRGGDKGNRNQGTEDEKGDRYREQEGPSDRAGSGQGAKKN